MLLLAGSLAGRLLMCPQFQVLDAVIVTQAVTMMHLFPSLQESAEVFFHHQPMF